MILVCQGLGRGRRVSRVKWALTWENMVMGYNFAGGGGGGDQGYLLAPYPREWLPQRHLAWELRAGVGGLDPAAVAARARSEWGGKQGDHPPRSRDPFSLSHRRD